METKQNMHDEEITDYWAEIDGGFRGSLILRLGALTLAIGVLANLGTQLLAGPATPSQGLTTISWLLFILGLWLTAAGFIWVGANPAFTRFGFVVGCLYAIQGIQILLLLFTFAPVTVPQVSMTIGRLISLLVFAWLERDSLSNWTRGLLAGTAGIQLLKVLLRELGYLPGLGVPMDPLLDTVFLLAVTAAILHLSTALRQVENEWAKNLYDMGNADFADFNNPEHAWNRPKQR